MFDFLPECGDFRKFQVSPVKRKVENEKETRKVYLEHLLEQLGPLEMVQEIQTHCRPLEQCTRYLFQLTRRTKMSKNHGTGNFQPTCSNHSQLLDSERQNNLLHSEDSPSRRLFVVKELLNKNVILQWIRSIPDSHFD